MNNKHRLLYILPVLWIIISAFLFMIAPNMDDLVREKGQISVPDGYPSKIAKEILKENEGFDGSTILVVYNNEDGITEEQYHAIDNKLSNLKEHLVDVPVEKVVSPFDSDKQRELMISADETTLMAVVQVHVEFGEVSNIRDEITAATQVDGVLTLLTGSELIEEDVIISSEEGLAKTEIITVIFVLVILLFVFRSLAAPLVPLITVGASYVMSISIVAFLVEYLNFPISNFTQIFIVAILFGIGTDYCILLLNRFKEELAKREDRIDAVRYTFKAVGLTVFYSALTGIIGFAAIGLANFSLYQSAVGVAVGIVVMMAAIWIWVPVSMLLLGEKLFWPNRGKLENKPNRLWGAMGKFAFLRPGWTMMILAIVVIPILLTYNNETSFNSLEEINDSYDSVHAFNLIAEKFGDGETLPLNVVVEYEDAWDQQSMLLYIELLSRELVKVDGVKDVRSATRPEGVILDDFRIPSIARELVSGMDEITEGLEEVLDGIDEVVTEVRKSEGELGSSIDDIQKLINGTREIEEGSTEIEKGIIEVGQGISQSVVGLNDIGQGLTEIQSNLTQLSQNPTLAPEIAQTLVQLAGGLTEFTSGSGSIASGLTEAVTGQEQLANGTGEITSGLVEVRRAQEEILQGYREFYQGMGELADGLEELAEGLNEIYDGLHEMSELLKEISQQSYNPLEGYFIPKEALEDEDFQAVWDVYATPNRKVAIFDIVLDVNPYSNEAMELVSVIEDRVEIAFQGTLLEDARFSISGLPSTNRDLEEISNDDFVRTAVIMLSGIFFVLILLLRSVVMPLYIIASLIITFVTSLAFTEWIFVDLLGYTGISWAVPFFGFVMLMALGVDYSIFLMSRFAENVQKEDVQTAMVNAMRQIGTVIISAAIILAGTFGAMIPSGVLSLMQIATLVLVGLLLYAFVMIPLFIPVMVNVFKEKSWWPWKLKRD